MNIGGFILANKNRTKQKQNNKSQNTQQVQETPDSASTKINNNETKSNNEFFKIVSQATLIVLLLTALTYSFTALFKSGYHHYYQLNDYSLLTIDTSDFVHFFLVSFRYLFPLTVAYVVVRYIFLAPEFFLRKGGVKSITIAFVITLLFVPIFISWIFNIDKFDNIYILAWAFVTNFIVFYQFFSPKVQSILQFLLTPIRPYKVFFILSAFIFLGIGSYRLGVDTAKKQEEYSIVTQGEEDLIVISTKGNSLITAPFNKDTNTIKSTFTVIPMKNQVSLKTTTLTKNLKVKSDI
ncbi:hypothetical protein CN357_03640 [Bacillus cereus]|uniref:Uncharacterized protein n=1 Tax=Bacillus cereus TaxID=1396 RepID=A0A9X6ZHC5_BACCE|nr:hypothetical protein CN357_03640 [Bacillus cereus]PGB10079.1 hypothetical protein COM09_23705 [Bacillus toyonensis]